MRKLSLKDNNHKLSKRGDLCNGGANGGSGSFLLENGNTHPVSCTLFQGAVELNEETDKILRLRNARRRV